MTVPDREIVVADTAAHFRVAHGLFLEYQAHIDVDLCFQGFLQELTALAQLYAAPRGVLLLACTDGLTLGCVGVRELTREVCEMKRLYVRPAYHGNGIGRLLARRAIAHARELGYKNMRLDTLASMHAAAKLYASLGFRPIAPYYSNPHPDVRYFELDLSEDR